MSANIKSLLSTLNSLIGNGTNLSGAASKFLQNGNSTQEANQFGNLLHGLVNKPTSTPNNTFKSTAVNKKDSGTTFKVVRNTNQDNDKVQKQSATDKSEQKDKVKTTSDNSNDKDGKTVTTNEVSDTTNDAAQQVDEALTPEMIAALLRQLQQMLQEQLKTQDTSNTDTTDNTDVKDVQAVTTTDATEQAPQSIEELSQKVLNMLEKLKNLAINTDQTQVSNDTQQTNIKLTDDKQKQITALLDKIKETLTPEDLKKPIKIEVEKGKTIDTEDLLNKIKLALDTTNKDDLKNELKPLTVQPEQNEFAAAAAAKAIAAEGSQDSHHQNNAKDSSDSQPDLFSTALAVSNMESAKFDIAPVLTNANGIQNLEAVRNTIISGVQNNNQQINLQLEPANLGQLRVQISRQVQQGEAVVSARLITSNIEAKDAIQNQISSLTQSLESQGIKVGKIEVVDAGKHQETVLNQMHQVFSNDTKVSESNQSQESTNQNPQNNQDGFTQNFSQFQQAFQEQQSQQHVIREYEKLYSTAQTTVESSEILQQASASEDLALQNASISLKV